MAASSHCHLWWRSWFDTLWVTLSRVFTALVILVMFVCSSSGIDTKCFCGFFSAISWKVLFHWGYLCYLVWIFRPAQQLLYPNKKRIYWHVKSGSLCCWIQFVLGQEGSGEFLQWNLNIVDVLTFLSAC